jgi:hypothetical protein
MRYIILVLGLCWAGLVVQPVQAQSAMAAAAETSAGFTQEEVTRWFASLRDLSAWGEANEDRFDSEHFGMKQPRISPMQPPSLEEIEGLLSPFSTAVTAANQAGVAGEIQALLQPHGFSLAEWGALGDRISRTYIALQMTAAGDMTGQLNDTISQMESNPHLSVAQKNQIISGLMQTLDIFSMLSDAPEADVESLRPMLGLVEQGFAAAN